MGELCPGTKDEKMKTTKIHDSELMRIVRDDCVIMKDPEVCARCIYETNGITHNGIRLESNPEKVLKESHRIVYIPRTEGKLRPELGLYAELNQDSGKWVVESNSYKKLGEFAEVEKMTKWAKSLFRHEYKPIN